MNCPVCSVPLIVVERQGIELDYCLTCRGIWFDDGELDLLGEALNLKIDFSKVKSLSPAAEITEKPYNCPRCHKKMDKIQYGDQSYLIDKCPKGEGVWFDHGELGKVIDNFSHKISEEAQLVKFLGETFKV